MHTEKENQSSGVVVPSESVCRQARCDVIVSTLGDGYRGCARVFEAETARRAVLYLHGIQSHGGWFVRSGEFLQRQSVTVVMPDRRGSGLNDIDRGHCDNPSQLIADVHHWATLLMDRTGLGQVDIVAVSWGGKLALAYAARYSELVRSITLVAPGLRPRIDVSLGKKIKIGVSGLMHPTSQYPIPLTDPALFTANPTMRAFIGGDPLMLRKATAGFFIASARLDAAVRHAVTRVHCPTYLLLAECDRIIDNQATVDLLGPILTAMPGRDEGAVVYSGAHHTLEFEADPSGFLADLGVILAD